uniref:Probable DNA polymerase n=1 Tax=Inonotus obliquus TaxID=167356 RepID=A0A5A4UBG4_9AGAM|nr:hypothetical protein [Inonotus obliquus]BBN21278.1 hypothetical protein [Inonotus obliquus]
MFYKTIINLSNNQEKVNYINNVIKYFNDHDYGYHPVTGDKIIINWIESNKITYDRIQRNKKDLIRLSEVPNYFDIPWNIDYDTWGKIKFQLDSKILRIENISFNENIDYILVEYIKPGEKDIKIFLKSGLVFNFIDKDNRNVNNNLSRYFIESKETIYFNNNKIYFYFNQNYFPKTYLLDKEGKPTNVRENVLSILIPEVKNEVKIGTYDFETYFGKDGTINLLSASMFDGLETKSLYLSNFPNSNELIENFFNKLLTAENNKSYWYAHNSAQFDLIFIVKHLLQREGVSLTPNYKDGKFLSIKIIYNLNGEKYKLTLFDSILLLLSGLDNLSHKFSIDSHKTIYPYYFPNENNLDYIGEVPAYKYFDDKKVSLDDYNNYKSKFNNNWSLKNETNNYCLNDCIVLHKIMLKFRELMLKYFRLDIIKCPTAASLSMRVFRTNYLDDKIIPNLPINIYNILVESYYGGHVDLYIPESNSDFTVTEILSKIKNKDTNDLEVVNSYDINSLYPSVMKDNLFPTELVGYFKGDITLMDEYQVKFGIYKVKVSVADSIKHPILPLHNEGKSIYPTGNWIGWYTSIEIENALQLGYKFEILDGFIFDTDDLFSKFVTDLYNLRLQYPKNHPMNYILKILMNSLYGRFGIDPNLISYKFIHKNEFNSSAYDDWSDFGEFILVGYKDKSNRIFSNVAVASAVTSFARIKMSAVKNRDDLILLYTDTDSAYIIGKLPDDLVSSTELGKFKLEDSYFKFIGLAPKVYGTLNQDGIEKTKVKGFKDKISLENLEKLLVESSHTVLKHEKWFKDMNKGLITVKISPYDLKVINNKRLSVFENNKFCNTKNVSVNKETENK